MKYRKPAIIAASLVIIYAIFGFFILPSIVKPKLIKAVEEATHRPVHLGNLHVNPFALSVTLNDFELKDLDSTRLVSFARLHINYEFVSLFRHAYVFSELLLDAPYVALRVLRNGSLSVHDLLENAPSDTSRPDEHPKALIIDYFVLTQGRILYQDVSRSVPMTKRIDSLNLSLKNFTTVPNEEGDYEFTAMTGRDEYLHWRGNVTVTPARSAGLLEVRNLRAASLWDFMCDRLKFRVDSGLLDVRANYELDAAGETTHFSIRKAGVDVSNLVLTDPNDSIPPVSLPKVAVAGISFDYPAQKLTLDNITVEGGDLKTASLADGTITLQNLLTPISDPADTSRSKLQLTINNLKISGTKFEFIEKMHQPEAPMVITDLALTLRNFCYGRSGVAQLDGAGVLNGGGTLGASGTLSLDPLKADFDVRIAGTPFAAFQPYASRYSRARLETGTASLQGKIAFAGTGGKTMFRLRGGVTLNRVRISDPVLNEDFTRWDRLELKGLDYTLTPPRMTITEIAATRPYIRVIISPDRTTNIQHVMAGGTASVADSSASATRDSSTARRVDTLAAERLAVAPGHAAGAGKPKDTAPPTVTKIGSFTIADGSMNFSDMSLTPNFGVSIQQMEGSIRGLSSEELARANVDIVGKVDKYAPVTISGQINPLSETAFTDILMKFEGIELTTFTPYAGKFAGYKIDRGKLNLDLRYKLNKRYLEGSNKIVLDQLTLGEEVEGPDVTNLPVKLVVALLKDSHGVIDLDIPVSGSLDDPEFSMFPLILKAILNVLWKIVTAPFALLGALFGGGGQELAYISFMPGADSLGVDQQTKLVTVSKGLANRPQLQLDVRGSSSNTADRDAIAESRITRKVRSTQDRSPLTAEEDKRLLALYQQTFKEDAARLVPEGGVSAEEREKAIVEAAKRRLIDSVQVTATDLRDLANRRAASIVDYLTQMQGVDPARVFLQEAETTVNPTDGMIRTQLSLTAH